MIRYHKSRKSRKSRRNPSKRRSKRSRARRNPSKRRRSPLKGRKFGHYKRVKSHKRRVNPKRRRRNPGMKGLIPSTGFLMQAATVVAGFIGGKFIISKVPDFGGEMVSKIAAPALSILAGAFMVKQSNKHLKNIGIGVAAAGVAQLVTAFVPGMQNALGVDLSGDGSDQIGYDDQSVVRVGDEMVQVGADLSDDLNGDSVYEIV